MPEPQIAFCVRDRDEPAVEVRVNFGVFAGRDVTPAEIDALARRIAPEIDEFAIIAEQRHEFGSSVEAALHQVRVEVARIGHADVDELCERVAGAAELWARACIAERHADVAEL
jgi:hypothetical protein